jgi:hypothetical protein
VKSSLWHQQTQNILNELHQMVNPPAPQPDGLQILDELRGEVADLKRQLEEDRNPDYPKLHSWHR